MRGGKSSIKPDSCLMENLPIDIVRYILSWLSIESILPCKLVCKTWRMIIGNKEGLLFASTLPSDVFIRTSYDQLYYGSPDHDLTKTLTLLDHRKASISSSWLGTMVGSCNGLVCFKAQNPKMHVAFVYNPMTGESIGIPGFRKQRSEPKVCGFGYVASTNEYKVVGFYIDCLYVYTLGKSSCQIEPKRKRSGCQWWAKGRLIDSISTDVPGIFANEALYWINDTYPGEILSFDLEKDKFDTLFLPSNAYGQNHTDKLMFLGGNLCYVIFREEQLKYLVIWMFKKAVSTSTHEKDYYDGSYECWSISWNDGGDRYMPFAITKSNMVLLCQNGKHLYTYDPKTSTLKKLWDSFHTGDYVQVIPQMITSVSMKDLGEVLGNDGLYRHIPDTVMQTSVS